MAERPAVTSFLAKRAAGIAQPVAKQIESTVKTVAKEAGQHGNIAPKAALSAARSLGSGGSSAKAVVSGGITALKEAGGQMLGKSGKGSGATKVKVTNIVEEIDVGAPRRLVYDRWTRFQEFPAFMKKVESTEQTADEKVRWKAKIFWSTRTWESTIVEQAPDERIVWRSTGDKGHVDGAVTFHELSPDLTRVLLVLEYHPKGFMEKAGNLWRAQGRRARLELKHFRRHVMAQALLHPDDDVDGWRGEIHDSEVEKSHQDATADEKRSADGRRRSSRSGASERSGRSSASSRSATGTSGGKKSSGTRRSSGTGRSSGTKKSAPAEGSSSSGGGTANGKSSSGTRRSTAKRTADAQEK